MTASPEGCGVTEHNELCLCDVIITKPTGDNYLAIPYEYPNGEAVAYFGKWDGTLKHWLEIYDKANMGLRAYYASIEPKPKPPPPDTGRYKRTLPDDVYDHLVDGIRRGVQPTPLRQELIDFYGITIHKSYVTKLKQRLTARGEL
jgi:hypothetical protein